MSQLVLLMISLSLSDCGTSQLVKEVQVSLFLISASLIYEYCSKVMDCDPRDPDMFRTSEKLDWRELEDVETPFG
jgi:hypothetical protein